jgi:hypothetical protein
MYDGWNPDLDNKRSIKKGDDKLQDEVFQAHYIGEHIFHVAEAGSDRLQQDGERLRFRGEDFRLIRENRV